MCVCAAARGVVVNAQFKLEQLRKDLEAEIAMWKQQIKEAEAWVQQKEGFEKFLEKQVSKREEIARGLTGDKQLSSPSTKGLDSMRRMMATAGGNVVAELSKYEAAFLRIGMSPLDITVESVLTSCRQQVQRGWASLRSCPISE